MESVRHEEHFWLILEWGPVKIVTHRRTKTRSLLSHVVVPVPVPYLEVTNVPCHTSHTKKLPVVGQHRDESVSLPVVGLSIPQDIQLIPCAVRPLLVVAAPDLLGRRPSTAPVSKCGVAIEGLLTWALHSTARRLTTNVGK